MVQRGIMLLAMSLAMLLLAVGLNRQQQHFTPATSAPGQENGQKGQAFPTSSISSAVPVEISDRYHPGDSSLAMQPEQMMSRQTMSRDAASEPPVVRQQSPARLMNSVTEVTNHRHDHPAAEELAVSQSPTIETESPSPSLRHTAPVRVTRWNRSQSIAQLPYGTRRSRLFGHSSTSSSRDQPSLQLDPPDVIITNDNSATPVAVSRWFKEPVSTGDG